MTLFLLLGYSLGCLAQIQVKGTIKDEKKAPLEFVNLQLLNPDSTLVSGTTSNTKGVFELNGIQAGSYRLIISYIGYQTQEIELNEISQSRDLGDLILQEDAFSLNGVSVTASAQRGKVDRKIVYPSERQAKVSANGVELLQQLMLPRLQVDPINNTIKVPGDGEVQLRINGVKVTVQEIRALRPDEIIRVEYHDNPGLRYGNAEIVLDYIVRRPELLAPAGSHQQRDALIGRLERGGAGDRLAPDPTRQPEPRRLPALQRHARRRMVEGTFLRLPQRLLQL